MKEQQLELDLTQEKEYTLTLTESECNTISTILSFVEADPIVNDIHRKLGRCIDEDFVEEGFYKVFLRQDIIETGTYLFPKEHISLINNGCVLVIKD